MKKTLLLLPVLSILLTGCGFTEVSNHHEFLEAVLANEARKDQPTYRRVEEERLTKVVSLQWTSDSIREEIQSRYHKDERSEELKRYYLSGSEASNFRLHNYFNDSVIVSAEDTEYFVGIFNDLKIVQTDSFKPTETTEIIITATYIFNNYNYIVEHKTETAIRYLNNSGNIIGSVRLEDLILFEYFHQ